MPEGTLCALPRAGKSSSALCNVYFHPGRRVSKMPQAFLLRSCISHCSFSVMKLGREPSGMDSDRLCGHAFLSMLNLSLLLQSGADIQRPSWMNAPPHLPSLPGSSPSSARLVLRVPWWVSILALASSFKCVKSVI